MEIIILRKNLSRVMRRVMKEFSGDKFEVVEKFVKKSENR